MATLMVSSVLKMEKQEEMQVNTFQESREAGAGRGGVEPRSFIEFKILRMLGLKREILSAKENKASLKFQNSKKVMKTDY